MSAMSLDDLYEAFEYFDDWEDRYTFIIELGRKLQPFPDDQRVDENRVWGCTSRVWLIDQTVPEATTLQFVADSDALIVRGLIAILMTVYSNQPVQAVLDANAETVFTRLGLENHLSPNRRSGFFSMVEKIKGMAHTYAR